MSGAKKNIFNAAFLLLVLIITLYSVFHGENLSELLMYLKQGDFRYWILGAVFVVGFIESESLIIYCIGVNADVSFSLNFQQKPEEFRLFRQKETAFSWKQKGSKCF